MSIQKKKKNPGKSDGFVYADKTTEGIMLNWIGVLIVLFAILVVYLVQNPR